MEKARSKRKVTPAQEAQRRRREREQEARERFELPEPGPNYGASELVVGDERIDQVAFIVRHGLVVSAACAGCGIPPEWEKHWLSTGLADFLAGRKTPYASFYDAIQRAYVQATGDLDRRIKKASAAHESTALKFLLERTRSDWYALRSDAANAVDAVNTLADLFAAHEATKNNAAPPLDGAPLLSAVEAT